MNRSMLTALAVAAALAVAGCGKKDASKSNFKAAIQAYLDTTPAFCASLPSGDAPFKVAKSGYGTAEALARAGALVQAGLLTSKDIDMDPAYGGKPGSGGVAFELTDKGRKYHVKDASKPTARQQLCGGKLEVTEVVNFTEPSDMMGAKVSRATYRYSVEDAPDWLDNDAVKSAYPELGRLRAASKEPKAAALIATNEGWMHERLFGKGE